MSEIFAIGDVQGCYDSLMALVEKLPIASNDRIWLCGDLVNRGPKSAEVLRWAMGQGSAVQVVLGNHDLHLLSAAQGHRGKKRHDTFGDVLEAEDRDLLLDWLRAQPLAYREGDYLMVHAGVHPSWTLEETLEIAEECRAAICEKDWFSAWKQSKPQPPLWDPELRGESRWAAAFSVLAGVRCVYEDGRLDTGFAGHPDDRPLGAEPWFAAKRCEAIVVFGHWAALGLHLGKTRIGLDTGCVWGRSLTAIRLSDRQVFQQETLESRSPIG